ncbi:MAG: hypothetical protein ACT4OG_05250 [Alphaproteobacteria bacterium]
MSIVPHLIEVQRQLPLKDGTLGRLAILAALRDSPCSGPAAAGV